jgi:hypothetical protein
MALPDTLERVGVVAGSALLLALPTSALGSLAFGPGSQPPFFPLLSPVPGLVAAVGAAALGVGVPSSGVAVGVGWWPVSVAVGLALARFPVGESLAAAVRQPASTAGVDSRVRIRRTRRPRHYWHSSP